MISSLSFTVAASDMLSGYVRLDGFKPLFVLGPMPRFRVIMPVEFGLPFYVHRDLLEVSLPGGSHVPIRYMVPLHSCHGFRRRQ